MTAVTTTPASEVTPARRRRMVAPAVTIGGLALLTVALHVRDPHQHASWGLCPSAALGVYCPGCGGLRAVNDLTHGDVAAAASSNLLFVVLLPFVVYLLGRWAWDRWRGTRRESPSWLTPTAVYAGFAVILLFTVLRNLPGSWLAP
ncbi:DUF2752 domain-containing protein [Nocardioides aquiterrae]|uniref:DUF2752 domain-containing protein n=1 Tax=Nocardioides aquiterrae TaxID=203799 RepID=A0ABP4F2T2_9ACTN